MGQGLTVLMRFAWEYQRGNLKKDTGGWDMDRTTKPEHKFNLSNVMEGLNGYIEIDEILNRLAEYEDTELEPSEITHLRAELEESQRRERAAVDGLSDLTENGFCDSCGQEHCHHRNHSITYCVDWQHRGVEQSREYEV